MRVETSDVNARRVCRASRGGEVTLYLHVSWVARGVQQDWNRMLDGFGDLQEIKANVMASARSYTAGTVMVSLSERGIAIARHV